MKSKKIIVAALVAVAAIALAGCSPRSSMATLSTDSDSGDGRGLFASQGLESWNELLDLAGLR